MRKVLGVMIVFLIVSGIVTVGVIVYQNRPFTPSDALSQARIVTFDAPALGWVPEGIVWDASRNSFIVSSLLRGDVGRVFLDGHFEPFIRDDVLLSTVGLAIDAQRQRLLVTSSSAAAFFGQTGAARLAAYDLATGQRLFHTDLTAVSAAERSFANDVAAAPDGTAYVTDSFASAVYRVDIDGAADVLISDPRLGSSFLGANGIVYHPEGFLLVANSGEKTLLKITLSDTPSLSVVTLDIPFGGDGMVVAEDGTLYAVARDVENRQFIASAVSEDGWESAAVKRIVETDGSATTLTWVNGELAYINAYLSEFLRRSYQIVLLAP